LRNKAGDLEGSWDAYAAAVGFGPSEHGTLAATNLGIRLLKHHDVARARSMFEFAVTSGPPTQAARAAYCLGCIREDNGELDGAREAFQQAASSGDPKTARLAAEGLTRLTPS
jgi:Tfp pilus assembly protein PilF